MKPKNWWVVDVFPFLRRASAGSMLVCGGKMLGSFHQRSLLLEKRFIAWQGRYRSMRPVVAKTLFHSFKLRAESDVSETAIRMSFRTLWVLL